MNGAECAEMLARNLLLHSSFPLTAAATAEMSKVSQRQKEEDE